MDARLIPMRPCGSTLQAGAHCSSGWNVATPWHQHDMHQILYAFEGSLTVEGTAGSYRIPRQFAALIPAGAAHRTRIQKVASGSIFISPDMLSLTADTPRVVAAPALMRHMLMHAMRWPLDRSNDDATSRAYFECFARLCEEWMRDEVRLVLPSSSDDRVERIMEFTKAHIADVNLGAVCKAAGMSARTLRRRFLGAVGISWEEYRQRLRIHRALEDLDGSMKSVGTIAADCGYENQTAFARAFRHIIGMSPSEYRRRANADESLRTH